MPAQPGRRAPGPGERGGLLQVEVAHTAKEDTALAAQTNPPPAQQRSKLLLAATVVAVLVFCIPIAAPAVATDRYTPRQNVTASTSHPPKKEVQPALPAITAADICINAGADEPRSCCRGTATRTIHTLVYSSDLPTATVLSQQTEARRCSVQVAATPGTRDATPRGRGSFDGGGRWWIERVGPFTTTGGMQTIEVNAPWKSPSFDVVPTGMGAELGADSQNAITGWEVGPVGVGGAVLGNPPIHPHHLVVRGSSRKHKGYTTLGYILSVTGSHSCPFESNAASCYRGNFEGRPQQLDGRPLEWDSIWNDVRPEGSPPLTWWVQIAFRGFRSPDAPGGAMGTDVGHPASYATAVPYSRLRMISLSDQRKATGGITQYFTYSLPRDAESFQWMSIQLPTDGTFDPAVGLGTVHTHSLLAKEALLFVGTPKQLGFSRGAANGDHCSASPAAAGFSNNTALLEAVLGRLPWAAATFSGPAVLTPRLVCRATPRSQTIDGAVFDRRPHVLCDAFNFTTNTVLTSLSTAGPAKGSYPDKTFWMHFSWYLPFAYTGDGPGWESYNYQTQYAKINTNCLQWWL